MEWTHEMDSWNGLMEWTRLVECMYGPVEWSHGIDDLYISLHKKISKKKFSPCMQGWLNA